MRLAAVYFPHDERFKSHTYNFGGCFSYKIKYSDNSLKIKRNKNELYVENFFNNEKITSISTIVGENGSGKTTLFKSLKNSQTSCILIFEEDEFKQFIYHTTRNDFSPFYKTDILQLFKLTFKNDNAEFESYHSNFFKQESPLNLKEFKISKLYYFPNSVYDLELNKIDDFIVKPHENNLATIKSLIFSKQIRLLTDTNLVNKIRRIYTQFPLYDSISIISADNFVNDFKYHDIRKFGIANHLDDYEVEKYLITSGIEIKPIFSKLNEIYNTHKNSNFRIFISMYYRLLYVFINNSNYAIVKVSGKLEDMLQKHLNYFNNEKTDFFIIKDLFECFLNGINFESKDDNNAKNVMTLLSNFLNYIQIVSDKIELEDRNTQELTDFIYAYYQILDFFEKNIVDNSSKQNMDISFLKFESGKNLSTGEISLLNFFSSIYHYRYENREELDEEELLVFLLDEPELGFHPLWKKRFVNSMLKVLPTFFPDKQIQVILSTHDPLTLSDFPLSNTIFLNKMEDNCLKVAQDNIPKQTFGSNVNELLVNSFFLKDELIGDFAVEKIEEVILQLNYFKLIKQRIDVENGDQTQKKIIDEELKKIASDLKMLDDKENTKKFTLADFFNEKADNIVFKTINIIGEPVIRYKLLEMYDEIFIDNPKKIKAEKIKRLMEESGLTIEDLEE